jgi:hypothetical protein
MDKPTRLTLVGKLGPRRYNRDKDTSFRSLLDHPIDMLKVLLVRLFRAGRVSESHGPIAVATQAWVGLTRR